MAATRTLKLVLELTLPEGVTDSAIKRVIDTALGEASTEAVIEKWPHANFTHKVKGFKEDPRLKTQSQTIQEQDARILEMSAKMDQLVDALEELKSKPTSATTINTIQTINAIINAINNEPVTIPPSTFSKTEYFKSGAREQRRAANEAIRRVGALLVAGIPQPGDAELFAYWIQEATLRPMRIMKMLSGADAIEEYRTALTAMRNEDQQALLDGTAKLVSVEGTLQ